MPNEMFLIRHGETVANRDCRLIGSTDESLSARGLSQVQALARQWAHLGKERFFCSPLLRARQTAGVLLGVDEGAVAAEDDLREMDFGCCEGRTFAEIRSMDPELVDRWAAMTSDFSFPQGESVRDFLERVNRVAEKMREAPEPVLVVVSHGGVIRALLCHYLCIPFRQYGVFEIQPASVTVLRFHEGKARLAGLNDRKHLEGTAWEK
ncbi:MAG: histidine phosphatase family protein [Verrucomicrobiae bacterium]|nr:histidine phosphatase family protein [Verrucomicrobiae bacterium]